MRVLLVFPPLFDPTQPYLASLEVRRLLRRQPGWTVDFFDWNVASYRALLSAAFIGRIAQRRGIRLREAAIERVDRSCDVVGALEGPDAIPAYQRAIHMMDKAFEWHSKVFPATQLRRYCGVELRGRRIERSSDLMELAVERDANVFDALYDAVLADRIAEGRYDAVGITVVCPDQLLAAFTLAHRLRGMTPSPRVVVGGPFFSLLAQDPPNDRIFDVFDAIYLGTAREDLAKVITPGVSTADLDGIACRDPDGIVRWRALTSVPPDWPQADWDGVDLSRYIGPALVMPVRASIGCAHGQCRFCSAPATARQQGHPGYRFRGAAAIAAEIEEHLREGRARHFQFSGDMIAWEDAANVARELEQRDLTGRCTWHFWNRLAPVPDVDLLRLLHRQGCRMISYGLETLDDPVLDAINKGVTTAQARETLLRSTSVGIQPHLFLIAGLPVPSSPDADAKLAMFLDELIDRGAWGMVVTLSPFVQEDWCRWSESPAQGGGARPPEDDLRAFQPPDPEAVERMIDLHRRLVPVLERTRYVGEFGNAHQHAFIDFHERAAVTRPE